MFGPEEVQAVAAVVGAGATLYAAPIARKHAAIRALAKRAAAQRALVLTYDDGPGPGLTRELIALLGEHGVHATFFVSGRRAEEHRDVVGALRAAGHELGSHGYEHVHAWRATPRRVVRDVRRGVAVVRGSGQDGPVHLFRPPYGKVNFATALAARLSRARLAWWTHDSGDSFPELPSELPRRAELLARGGVVLLHDLDRSAPRNAYVLRVTRELLEAAPRAGLRVLTLGALLD